MGLDRAVKYDRRAMTDATESPGGTGSRRPLRQEQEDASPEVTEVAPGILRMQLPIVIPGLGHVNMYGLIDGRGLAVVDPGLPGPQSWKALEQRLKSAGYGVKDVHTVIVTHSHPDHFGNAGRLAKETGADLVAHHAFSTWTVKGPSEQRALTDSEALRAESDFAALAVEMNRSPDEIPTIEEAAKDDPDVIHDDTEEQETTARPWGTPTPWGTKGFVPPLRRRLSFRLMSLMFTSPEPTRRVHHGERIRLADRDWVTVHTPGHTVDHVCLLDAETGTLLCGDHVLPTITPHVSGVQKADSLKSYLATLDLVADIEGVNLALPAHGHPFTDLRGRVAEIKEHHAERMELLRRVSNSVGPATVSDLSKEVFPERHWGIMAEAETYAHLEHLVHSGQAERWSEDDRLLYRVAPAPA